MASLPDCVVPTGAEVSEHWEVSLQATVQATSASISDVYRPSGSMARGILLLPANKNRVSFECAVFGTSPKLSFGAPLPAGQFSVVMNAASGGPTAQRSIFNTGLAHGSVVYTGPIYAFWDGTALASSSYVIVSELTGG